MVLYTYDKCSTCKKAKKYLEEHSISYENRSIVDNPPSYEEIKDWFFCFDVCIDKLFNTSGVKYRELKLKDKLLKMSLEEKIKLLSSDGMLIKRPILYFNDGDKQNFMFSSGFLYGFHENEWDIFFSKLK